MSYDSRKAVAHLAQSVSHELRNMAASLAIESKVLSVDTLAKRHFDRLMVLSGRLSAMSSPKDLPSFEIISIKRLLSRAVTSLVTYVEAAEASLNVNWPNSSALVRGDAHRVYAILVNLLFTAIEVLPSQGGTIEIDLAVSADRFCLSIRASKLNFSKDGSVPNSSSCEEWPHSHVAEEGTNLDLGHSPSGEFSSMNWNYTEQVAIEHGWKLTVECSDPHQSQFQIEGSLVQDHRLRPEGPTTSLQSPEIVETS